MGFDVAGDLTPTGVQVLLEVAALAAVCAYKALGDQQKASAASSGGAGQLLSLIHI